MVLFLSITLPLGIACWSVKSALLSKPLVRPSNEDKNYYGVLHRGELWFRVLRFSDKHDPSDYFGEWRIKRLDLETGVERETGVVMGTERCWPCVVNDEIYLSGPDVVYKLADSRLIKVTAEDAKTPIYSSGVFEFNGQLTNAVETTDGEFQLHHLKEGYWVAGRKFRVPKRGSEWVEPTHFKLQPPNPKVPSAAAAFPLTVSIKQLAGVDHVSVYDTEGFAAYRIGLDFIDDDHQHEVSALIPENDLQDPAGWEPVQPIKPDDRRWSGLQCDREGVLFATWPRQGRVVRRSADGDWADLEGLPVLADHSNRLVIAAPTEGKSYVVDSNGYGFSSVFYRIEGNGVQPPHLTIHDCGTEYLARWQRMLIGVFVAWLVHLGVLFAGIAWLGQGETQSSILSGRRHATLASISRRVLAGTVDSLLLLATFFVLGYVQSILFQINLNTVCGVELKPFIETEVCESLIQYESVARTGIRGGFNNFASNLRRALQKTWGVFFRPVDSDPTIVVVAIVEGLCLIGFKIYIEGRSGITPGKWLLGIRMLRSTLLPCGFSRALVRSALFCVDIPFFVTPLPAAISLMLSTRGQRLGDRLADAVVVNARTIRCLDKDAAG